MSPRLVQALTTAASLFSSDLAFKENNSFPKAAFGTQSRAIVLDRFNTATVDLNRDGKPDIAHGRMVAATLASKGVNVIQFEMKGSVADSLASLVEEISEGRLPKSPVNISLGYDVSLQALGRIISVPDLSSSNLASNLPKVRKVIADMALSGDTNQIPVGLGNHRFNITTPELFSTLESLRTLGKLGCPVFVSAGNSGPKNINFLALAEGVTVVGSLNRDGKRDPKSSFIDGKTVWSQGSHVISLLPGGIDYTLDGRIDPLPSNFPSIMKLAPNTISRISQRFQEQINSLSQEDKLHVKATQIADILENAGLKTGTYSCEDFQKITGIPPADSLDFGVVFYQARSGHPPSFTFIKSPNGTSIASPNALANASKR